MLRVALELRLQPLTSAAQKLTRSRLLDLIAQAFLAELAPLLREGLAKGYRTTQSNGAVFRGRLKIAEHLRDNFARADRFFVEYQTFDHDIELQQMFVDNELLGAPRAILLYRETSTSTSRSAGGRYATKPHTCEQRHLGLCQEGRWSGLAIQQQLAQLLVGLASEPSSVGT
jgi:McrBC 5-methylcytosine restriction system component